MVTSGTAVARWRVRFARCWAIAASSRASSGLPERRASGSVGTGRPGLGPISSNQAWRGASSTRGTPMSTARSAREMSTSRWARSAAMSAVARTTSARSAWSNGSRPASTRARAARSVSAARRARSRSTPTSRRAASAVARAVTTSRAISSRTPVKSSAATSPLRAARSIRAERLPPSSMRWARPTVLSRVRKARFSWRPPKPPKFSKLPLSSGLGRSRAWRASACTAWRAAPAPRRAGETVSAASTACWGDRMVRGATGGRASCPKARAGTTARTAASRATLSIIVAPHRRARAPTVAPLKSAGWEAATEIPAAAQERFAPRVSRDTCRLCPSSRAPSTR
ncbi:hypothetical protein ROTAS13_03228 [Roseomonas sp. TAS13]|nr:hypothetical protein ROTAS13_03228 [Roseomonas sp. TAS13]